MAGPETQPGPAVTRPIRTFKPRRRALSPARAEQFAQVGQRWLLDTGTPSDMPLDGRFDPVAVFGRVAPLVIEIGIGAGEALVPMALADPAVDVVGIDVHTPGISVAMATLDAAVESGQGGSNVRLVHGDALEFIAHVTPGTVHGLRVFFPDPWPKIRHRHRRLIGERHLDPLVALLEPGGFLHVATDVDDYAVGAREVCEGHPDLVGGPIDRPSWRPVTRFERKGLDAGHTVTDLYYERRST